MASPLLLLCTSLLLVLGHGGSKWKAAARTVPVEYLYPPYDLTYFEATDTNGVFLRSPNATFSAAVYSADDSDSSDTHQSRFVFSVLHDASRIPVWTAPSVSTTVLSLTASGLAISDPVDQSGPPSWSTPADLAAPVAALRLLDTGQLALLDAANATLWSSFDAPTDTLLQGQTLPVGVPLTATVSDRNLSPGAYRLILTTNDALLQWQTSESGGGFVTYWALSSDAASVQQSNQTVHSMKVNASGIYLLADNAIDAVFTLRFSNPSTSNKFLKVDSSGRLRALSMTYSPTAGRATLPAVWNAPASDCDLPLQCGSLGLCTLGNNTSSCMCPDAFSRHNSGGCSPADGSTLPIPAQTCHASNASSSSAATEAAYAYMSLGHGIAYFGSNFAVAATAGDALPACRDLCSANCSCLGFLYKNSSKSCYLVHDQIGSVFRANTNSSEAGFVKTLPLPSRGHGSGSSTLSPITIAFGIVLPTMAAVVITFLLYVLAARWLKNRPDGGKKNKRKKKHSGHGRSWFMIQMMSLSSSRASSNAPSENGDDNGDHHDDDDAEVLIPGLPARFTFADLETATGGFRSQIGSGGFGSVYRGELPDRTTVAVKRMNNLGTQGRREFLTEIAVIGNVHHVNLVKLRGFCADQSRQLMLVYEYMSRGSLDQSLFLSRFGGGDAGASASKKKTLLEWPERVGVCVGAARGLAYLHAGCDRKILHCDVKPENILLDERGGVKIADFGLAKLLSPEQSGLFTTMRGTRGYLAPEWLTDAPVSDKADVYSFGMVLLEILRGTKNSKLVHQDEEDTATGSVASVSGSTSSDGRGGGYFPAVALEVHEEGGRRYGELVDPRLEGRANAAEVARVVRVALCCLHEDASLRPPMTAVAAMLDGSMEVREPRPEQLAYLRMYGRGIGGGKWKGSHLTTGDGASISLSQPSCVSAQQLSAAR
ncbi:hypothetical protein ACQ4PT_036508 [Festuca glaucescens]